MFAFCLTSVYTKQTRKWLLSFIKLFSAYEDLFETDESREDNRRERIYEIPLTQIKDFPNHQYHVNLSAVNRVVNRLMNNAGLKHCTIHGLRHSVASMLDENGVPIQDISILLGHENISTTEKIYIHRNRKAKVETTNVLDRLINSN